MKTCLVFYVLIMGIESFCQDTTFKLPKYEFDIAFLNTLNASIQMSSIYLNQSPNDEDEKNFAEYGYLIGQKPSSENYKEYYSLGCSLWELNRLKEAEEVFLQIIGSNEKHFSTTNYHSSDVPGDTTTNIYGYGSFTSNYKNTVALYLTKIYIKQKRFDRALIFLQDAVKKYKVRYSCGTGFYAQKDQYDFLYASCYEGLKQYNNVFNLLISNCLWKNDEIIVRAIKKLYTPEQIKKNLIKAEKSLRCSFDTFPSYSYRTSYDSENETITTDTICYFSGRAIMKLFGKTIQMSPSNLNDGEHVTKEYFIKEFKETGFYINLSPSKKEEVEEIPNTELSSN